MSKNLLHIQNVLGLVVEHRGSKVPERVKVNVQEPRVGVDLMLRTGEHSPGHLGYSSELGISLS